MTAVLSQYTLLAVLAVALTGCGRRIVSSDDAPPPQVRSSTPVRIVAAPAPRAPQQQDAASSFEASTTAVLRATDASGFQTLTPLNQVSLTVASDGLVVEASGTDPQLLLPRIEGCARCIVQVTMTAPVGSFAQLFYTSREHPTFDAAQSQLVETHDGENVIYFQLDQPCRMTAIRFDPGAQPGRYVIRGIIAHAVD